MSSSTICPLCGGPVAYDDPDVYDQHVGFARPRDQGGLNKLHLRETTGVVAHSRCVVAARHSIVPGQIDLFEAA